MLPFVYVTINFINVVSCIISSSCKRLIFIPRLLLHTNCHLFTEISSTHKFTPIHRNFIILKSFLNNHFVWMLSFVDTCLRFIANVIYFIDWHFFSRIMHLFPIVTIDKPALYLMEHNCKFVLGIASQQRVIVFINLTVWSLLITLSESTSQPIPKSRSKTLVSSVSYLTMFLKMPLSFALANSCDSSLTFRCNFQIQFQIQI